MAEPRLIAVVTALLMLVAASPLRAAYDLNQLREIDRLMSSADWAGLAAYLRSLTGVEADTAELADFRAFVLDPRRGGSGEGRPRTAW